ncbi:MAG TPA: bifunctional folylpolyglutamate synthase/dihydrofolate synthase, partial [Acholeplasmataceae bacterium]|nr:bifunctional folylpolyglutamate synthase/dihydrofolate synthase [Acholeplasmataceae bacterium]
MFYNIDDAINWVVRQTKFREKTDLSIMKEAFKMLNINLDEIKKIHLAGTNGKGSTGAFLSEILVSNNYKVGWFTSPYLVKFNERVKINNLDINDNDLLKYINYFYDFNEALYLKNNVKLSFFEILTLLSFKYFKDNNVDVMLIEVGIGGRLDATNIINYDVSIITSIGFDHMQQLGDTLESIAYEKVAILKKHGYLITNVNESLKKLMINYSKDLNATI